MRREGPGGAEPEGVEFVCGRPGGVVRIDARRRLLAQDSAADCREWGPVGGAQRGRAQGAAPLVSPRRGEAGGDEWARDGRRELRHGAAARSAADVARLAEPLALRAALDRRWTVGVLDDWLPLSPPP